MPFSTHELELNNIQCQLVLEKIYTDLQAFNEFEKITLLKCNFGNLQIDQVENEKAAFAQINTDFRDPLLEILDTENQQTYPKELYPIIFNFLLLLVYFTTRHASTTIPEKDLVVFPTGAHLNRNELDNYLTSSVAQGKFLDPITKRPLSLRAQSYIQNANFDTKNRWVMRPSYKQAKSDSMWYSIPKDFAIGGFTGLGFLGAAGPLILAAAMIVLTLFVFPALPIIAACAASGAIVLGGVFVVCGLIGASASAITKNMSFNAFEKRSIKAWKYSQKAKKLFDTSRSEIETVAQAKVQTENDMNLAAPTSSTNLVNQQLQITITPNTHLLSAEYKQDEMQTPVIDKSIFTEVKERRDTSLTQPLLSRRM